jgi:hypothetical protein
MTHLINPVSQHRSHQHPGKEDDMSAEQLKQQLTAPPSVEELARRRALVEHIKVARQGRAIAPLTTADLVHQAREETYPSYGDDR